MDPLDTVRALNAGRAGMGATLVAVPSLVARTWLGPDGRRPAAKVALRAMGARDLAIGVGALRAVDRGEAVAPWLLAGIVADGADAAATLLAFRQLPRAGRWLVLGVAVGAMVAGVWAAGQLE